MAQMQNIIDFPIEPVGTRVLEDRLASILPYFDDSRLPPWARHLTRPARAAAATLLRQARQWRAPMKADLPLVKKPFAQMRPKIDRLSEIGCAPCPLADDATAAVTAQWKGTRPALCCVKNGVRLNLEEGGFRGWIMAVRARTSA